MNADKCHLFQTSNDWNNCDARGNFVKFEGIGHGQCMHKNAYKTTKNYRFGYKSQKKKCVVFSLQYIHVHMFKYWIRNSCTLHQAQMLFYVKLTLIQKRRLRINTGNIKGHLLHHRIREAETFHLDKTSQQNVKQNYPLQSIVDLHNKP